MERIKQLTDYFSKAELLLWSGSVSVILLSFVTFDRVNYITPAASIIGVTSLIFSAKGNPLGQLLMVIFSLFYGWISFGYAYYGEMITYLGMTAPMAFFALVSWLRHPYKGKRSQVRVNSISKKEICFMSALTAIVTVIFYFVLKRFSTANLIMSTLSVATSFAAVYLTFRRSPCFALLYAANDVVLIVLWILASFSNKGYISVVICFGVFLINDLYGFYNWTKIKNMQKNSQKQ